jgi:hypothetical protein
MDMLAALTALWGEGDGTMEADTPSPDTTPIGGQSESVTYRIADRIAAEYDASPLDLPPLHDYVDVDAIEALLADGRPGTVVSVVYEAVLVTVRGDGTVTVVPKETTARSETERQRNDSAHGSGR